MSLAIIPIDCDVPGCVFKEVQDYWGRSNGRGVIGFKVSLQLLNYQRGGVQSSSIQMCHTAVLAYQQMLPLAMDFWPLAKNLIPAQSIPEGTVPMLGAADLLKGRSGGWDTQPRAQEQPPRGELHPFTPFAMRPVLFASLFLWLTQICLETETYMAWNLKTGVSISVNCKCPLCPQVTALSFGLNFSSDVALKVFFLKRRAFKQVLEYRLSLPMWMTFSPLDCLTKFCVLCLATQSKVQYSPRESCVSMQKQAAGCRHTSVSFYSNKFRKKMLCSSYFQATMASLPTATTMHSEKKVIPPLL